jgi:hypothetical protein
MIDTNFLQNNKKQLIQIYIKEKIMNYNQIGALFIDFSKGNNANVYYLTLQNMPEEIKNRFLEKENLNQKNTIFFYTLDESTSNIIEIIL